MACAHFMSRLDENAKMHWSKYTCKASIESFIEDRHNFEHFLTVFSLGIKNQDQKITNDCKTFLEDFLQKCMYLEKCVQPKFYTQFLERLLESSKREIQPVHTVELLCLLGHEMRKVGQNEKYNTYMAKAIQLYSEKKLNLRQRRRQKLSIFRVMHATSQRKRSLISPRKFTKMH